MSTKKYNHIRLALQATDKDFFSIKDIFEVLSKIEEQEAEHSKKYFTFGKYRGKKIAKVADFDIGYIRWLKGQPFYDRYATVHDEIDRVLSEDQ